MTTSTTPKGTTHIKVDSNNEPVTYYKVSPVKFSDGTTGTRIQYFNFDFESWQGCVNTYKEVFTLINSNDANIIKL